MTPPKDQGQGITAEAPEASSGGFAFVPPPIETLHNRADFLRPLRPGGRARAAFCCRRATARR